MQTKYGISSVAIALLLGLAIGFGGAMLGFRYEVLPIPGERPFHRMARVLELTPAQREQIRNVMHETRGRIEAARSNCEHQRHAIFFRAYVRIRALLTPSQQKVFDTRFVPPSIRAEAQAQPKTTAAPPPSPGVH